jgi:hypothetical protein
MEFPESTRCFLISALGCFVMESGVSATASNQFDFYNFLGNQPIAGIPSGTYSDCPEDQRREALKLIKLACVRASFAGMMAVSNQNSTEVQKTEEIRTLTATCIANHLPRFRRLVRFFLTSPAKPIQLPFHRNRASSSP